MIEYIIEQTLKYIIEVTIKYKIIYIIEKIMEAV